MLHSIEQFLAAYGLIVVFIGVIIEGDSVLLAAGFLAHQGILDPWGVFLAAFAGSLTSDQIFYHLGRSARQSRFVKRQTDRPLFTRVMDLIHRRRALFILSFRFIYGIRAISPIALGIADVPPLLFTTLNTIAALIWAAVITLAGYFFGQVIERWAGRLHGLELKLGIAAAIGIAALLTLHLVRSRVLRSQTAGTQPEDGAISSVPVAADDASASSDPTSSH